MYEELELQEHDIATIKMDAYMLALEAVDEGIHVGGAEQVAAEEDIFDVQIDAELLGARHQLGDSLAGAAVAEVGGDGLVILEPRNMDRAGDDEQVLCAQFVGG